MAQENASKQKDVFACLPTGEDVEGVKVFTIAYGKDADTRLLKQIADRTNGKTFSRRPATIEQVYLAIRPNSSIFGSCGEIFIRRCYDDLRTF